MTLKVHAIRFAGEHLYAMGWNSYGQVPTKWNQPTTPVFVDTPGTVTAVAAGVHHSAFIAGLLFGAFVLLGIPKGGAVVDCKWLLLCSGLHNTEVSPGFTKSPNVFGFQRKLRCVLFQCFDSYSRFQKISYFDKRLFFRIYGISF